MPNQRSPTRCVTAEPPILSIPMELTQKIMQETLAASTADSGRLPQPFTRKPPLLFTRICRQWRNISVNTPELWQAIQVDRNTATVRPKVVSLWASRAANHPLDIQLEDVCNRDSRRGAVLLKESMKFYQQWRDIRLVLPIESFRALDADRGPFPILRSLHISETSGPPKRLPIIITVQDAPLLRKLTDNSIWKPGFRRKPFPLREFYGNPRKMLIGIPLTPNCALSRPRWMPGGLVDLLLRWDDFGIYKLTSHVPPPRVPKHCRSHDMCDVPHERCRIWLFVIQEARATSYHSHVLSMGVLPQCIFRNTTFNIEYRRHSRETITVTHKIAESVVVGVE
ncbi:hypothetical protein DFH06DRAFT_1206757 [Mycena polygramma]|nr:hypothetical protein DFH06DRAFT_1206757 [Mycena polygramma]